MPEGINFKSGLTSKGSSVDEWEISTDDIIMEEQLGKGAFGDVYKGVIRVPLENPKLNTILRKAIGVPVAIKMLKSESHLSHWIAMICFV